MPKIMVLQHSPYEPLGIIINTLKRDKMRLRYVNFHRNPAHQVGLDGYDGLIVLGGSMNPDERTKYQHLNVEIALIQQAILKNIPVLGICLGSQLLNLALGGTCYSLPKPEFGWSNVYKKANHPMFSAFAKETSVFQWHQYASSLSKNVEVILENDQCVQAFCYQDIFIGLQFHLEVDFPLISRWLEHPDYLTHLEAHLEPKDIQAIKSDTKEALPESMDAGLHFFKCFGALFNKKKHTLLSMHAGKNTR